MRVAVLALGLAVLLAACGDDRPDGDDSPGAGLESCGLIELPDSNRGDEYMEVSANRTMGCTEALRRGKEYAHGRPPTDLDCIGASRLTCRGGGRVVVFSVAFVQAGGDEP